MQLDYWTKILDKTFEAICFSLFCKYTATSTTYDHIRRSQYSSSTCVHSPHLISQLTVRCKVSKYSKDLNLRKCNQSVALFSTFKRFERETVRKSSKIFPGMLCKTVIQNLDKSLRVVNIWTKRFQYCRRQKIEAFIWSFLCIEKARWVVMGS